MLTLSDEQRAVLAGAAAKASGIAPLRDEVARLYADFEADRAARSPRCDRSGACCRFEAYGHRLFVTGIELAVFARGVDGDGTRPDPSWDGTGCPYQIGGLCTAHAGRPFGCRVFFCDPDSEAWQQASYERFQAAIRELHDRYDVPYVYAEWRQALAAVGRAGVAPPSRRLALPLL